MKLLSKTLDHWLLGAALLTLVDVGLVKIILVRYSYSQETFWGGVAAATILAVITVWFAVQSRHLSVRRSGWIKAGLGVGLLWTIEICINNIVSPGLPLRDIVDDVFWGIVAFSLAAIVVREVRSSGHWRNGLMAGMWSGVMSGLVACTTALTMVVFGMANILRDPLNVVEWSHISGPPSMAAYFSFQTMAGGILHVVVLGVMMGAFEGVIVGWLLTMNKKITHA